MRQAPSCLCCNCMDRASRCRRCGNLWCQPTVARQTGALFRSQTSPACPQSHIRRCAACRRCCRQPSCPPACHSMLRRSRNPPSSCCQPWQAAARFPESAETGDNTDAQALMQRRWAKGVLKVEAVCNPPTTVRSPSSCSACRE